MSLLMDALKRAEETKQDAARQMTSGGRAPAGNLSLEPLGNTTPASLPDLAQHIDALDADLAASARPPARPPPAQPRPTVEAPPAPDTSREAVRNAFAAKQPATGNPNLLWITLGVLALAATGIGAYVWYQLTQMGNNSLARAPAVRPPVAASAAAPAPALPAVAAQNMTPPPLERNPLPAADMPPRRPDTTELGVPAAERPASSQTIRLIKTRPEADPNLARGYQNLQAGALDTARRDYEQALKGDAKNVDTLLGLAAIAQKQGRGSEAERYQQLALEADPKDASAQAAVIGNAATADPVAVESRLKILLAAQPESGPLNFALGNLYSRQGRWADAQPAYFNAVAAEGDNPDYLMNLAVSLDHLHQPRLAAQHYRLALEAAERRPAAFAPERVKKRLLELQP